MTDARDGSGLIQAFVLHRRDYSDTSLLLELFATGLGRFPAIAKGARRPRNPASALLQPFQPLWVGVVGRGEVRTLTRVEPAGPSFQLLGRNLPCGLYLNELLSRLLGRHDAHNPLFAFYHAALGGLALGELEPSLRQFELRLLEELGYGPSLGLDAETGLPIEPGLVYVVEPGRGPRRAFNDATSVVVSGATLLALVEGRALEAHQQREARGLMRRLIDPHLGPKPLRSRELFRAKMGA